MSRNDDLISRQGAIDALTERFKRVPTNAIIAKAVIENLPSTRPEDWMERNKERKNEICICVYSSIFVDDVYD